MGCGRGDELVSCRSTCSRRALIRESSSNSSPAGNRFTCRSMVASKNMPGQEFHLEVVNTSTVELETVFLLKTTVLIYSSICTPVKKVNGDE